MKDLFTLRADLSEKANLILFSIGLVFLLAAWTLTSMIIPSGLLPSPLEVLKTFPSLHFKDALVKNVGYSMYLNCMGYIEAVLICIPLGFIVGLFPIFKGMFSKSIDSIRFIPLTAVTGLFIAWFGIHNTMKIQFLAFGIIVYLLPIVVQRVNDVENVYQQTAFTLGASRWQTIKTVFVPSVMSKLIDDIRVLVAISWTYIIVAEMLNKSGGIGGMLYTVSRQGRIDKVFALLFVIILIGFVQDKFFSYLDKKLFPYKEI
jgi:NitT/TauT family transport system permease protein